MKKARGTQKRGVGGKLTRTEASLTVPRPNHTDRNGAARDQGLCLKGGRQLGRMEGESCGRQQLLRNVRGNRGLEGWGQGLSVGNCSGTSRRSYQVG